MNRITNLDQWHLPSGVTPANTQVKIAVSIKPADDLVRDIASPKERIKQARQFRKEIIETLVSAFGIVEYVSARNHHAILLDTTLEMAGEISNHADVEHVTLQYVFGGKRKKVVRPHHYWCLKVQFTIQVEGLTTGLISVDEQLILVKAMSKEEAINNIKPYIEAYETPQLNSDGRWVRWIFDQVLDSYETTLTNPDDFKPEGVEVFSEIKRRRMKPDDYWDGAS